MDKKILDRFFFNIWYLEKKVKEVAKIRNKK